MKYNDEELNLLETFIDEYLQKQEEKYKHEEGLSKEKDTAIAKIEHIKRTVSITNMIAPNNRIAKIAAKFHDIGRFPQIELLGGFRDDLILHHNLGEDLITRQLFQKKLTPSHELDVIREAVMYHGRTEIIPFKENPLSEDAIYITDIISTSDDLDNGCIGALGYLERETLTDAKGYIAANPELDMKLVSPRVMEYFRKGEKFNKLTECKTYADYILFASVLAIQSLKGKYRNIAQSIMNLECFGFENALEGYEDLFNRYIGPEYSREAFDILVDFYNGRELDYVDKGPSI